MHVSTLYEPFRVQRKLPLNYDRMYAGKESFIRTEEDFPAIRLYEADDAYVSPYGVVFRRGRVERASVYGMFDARRQWPSFAKKIVLGKTIQTPETVLVAHHAYYENYYHWLCEILPRLFVAVRALGDRPFSIAMHERQPRFVKAFLERFAPHQIIAIPDDALLRPATTIFPSHIARPLAYHEGILRELADWLRARLYDPAHPGGPEKIFITRKNARYRITRNEAELEAWLVSKGFSALAPENYSVREQANLFRNARIIIGSHGAGFSNLLFAPGCRLIVDIIHREHPQDCFYNLAGALGADTYFFQCEGAGKLDYKNNDDVIADLPQFIRETEPLLT